MQEILLKAGYFVAIIILGIVLRSVGFFKDSDFDTLAKICLRIALPASVVVSFSQLTVEMSMLVIILLPIVANMIYMLVSFLISTKKAKPERAFDVMNMPGYNIGLFTLPFVQSFFGPLGVIVTGLFDTGNAFFALGGTYSVAACIRNGDNISLKRIFKALFTSVPFLFFFGMTVLNVSTIRLPDFVVSFADVIKNANAFLAMLMIGVGFKINTDKKQIGYILKILFIRYSIAAIIAWIFYFVLPFALEIRQALVLLAFSPISSATPVFTRELKEDYGLSSTINSFSIVCSIIIMVTLLSVML